MTNSQFCILYRSGYDTNIAFIVTDRVQFTAILIMQKIVPDSVSAVFAEQSCSRNVAKSICEPDGSTHLSLGGSYPTILG